LTTDGTDGHSPYRPRRPWSVFFFFAYTHAGDFAILRPMYGIYKLKNQIKHYPWGSPEWIPELLGEPNPQGAPWAELWMGTHPEGPSEVEEEKMPLDRLIGGDLPFLFKVLAAEAPLSIQAHPNAAQAAAGWERENDKKIPLDSPLRSYRDNRPKPEILCALSPFQGVCGFKTPEEIGRALEGLAAAASVAAIPPLVKSLAGGLEAFARALFALPRNTFALSPAAARRLASPEGELAADFAARYPEGDPGVLSPFYLNVVTLAPGEAVYLPAGILHAYVHGLGVELMVNSDNVLRGGLTAKHIDPQALLEILDFRPYRPRTLFPEKNGPGAGLYRTPCRDFSLRRLCTEGAFSPAGPTILLVTRGQVTLSPEGAEGRVQKTFHRGESAFILPGKEEKDEKNKKIILEGEFCLFAAGGEAAGE